MAYLEIIATEDNDENQGRVQTFLTGVAQLGNMWVHTSQNSVNLTFLISALITNTAMSSSFLHSCVTILLLFFKLHSLEDALIQSDFQ